MELKELGTEGLRHKERDKNRTEEGCRQYGASERRGDDLNTAAFVQQRGP